MRTLFFIIYFLFLASNLNSQDFNYEFIAHDVVATKIDGHGYDTLNVTTRIAKKYNMLFVTDNNNMGQTIYSQSINNIGAQVDGDLVYRGKGIKYNYLIFINPLKKTVKVYNNRKLVAQYGLENTFKLIPESYK